jgi:hypothetical protein
MGDKGDFSGWAAASILVIAIFSVGSTIAKDTYLRGDAQTSKPVLPRNYQLPRLEGAFPPPAQPIPFSHARHVGMLALACATCHVGAGPNAVKDERSMNGAHMTLPETKICMNCHVAIAADRPNIQTLAKYHAASEDVPWVRIYSVLKGVNWTHKAHVGAGIKCQTCHGDVGKMEEMHVATPVTAMASCLGCHRATQAKSQCETCHAWPSPADFRRWSN